MLASLGARGCVITQRAKRDSAVFDEMLEGIGVPALVLDCETTSAFELLYSGERRQMTVTAMGDPWTAERFTAVSVETTWVHVAPLLRSDFPVATIAALAAAGHHISFDGQGLVRAADLGPMVTNSAYEHAMLRHLTVLKLADDEAAILAADGAFDEDDAARLGVQEILVTFGSGGVDVYTDGARRHVSSDRSVQGVHTTGSGDMFAVAYAAGRAAGIEPAASALDACGVVADVLERRRAG